MTCRGETRICAELLRGDHLKELLPEPRPTVDEGLGGPPHSAHTAAAEVSGANQTGEVGLGVIKSSELSGILIGRLGT